MCSSNVIDIHGMVRHILQYSEYVRSYLSHIPNVNCTLLYFVYCHIQTTFNNIGNLNTALHGIGLVAYLQLQQA